VDFLVATKLPAFFMLLFFIGIVVSTWIALDPIRQKQRKSKYFLVTLICFIGFLLVAAWDLR
jgi:formate hydrogenlyase subunit 3/multisubunit Na+/H+ antiporter MnhD subunit